MDRHEWTHRSSRCVVYPVADMGTDRAPSHTEFAFRFASDEVAAAEILRLAEENRGLKAPVLLDDQEVLVGAAEVARRANEEIQAVAERFSAENRRLAEELDRANASVGEANLEADRLRGDLAEVEADRDRLDEEVERLKAEKQEVLSIFMKGPDVLLAAERARIRRELKVLLREPRWKLVRHPLLAEIDRIVPEEG